MLLTKYPIAKQKYQNNCKRHLEFFGFEWNDKREEIYSDDYDYKKSFPKNSAKRDRLADDLMLQRAHEKRNIKKGEN